MKQPLFEPEVTAKMPGSPTDRAGASTKSDQLLGRTYEEDRKSRTPSRLFCIVRGWRVSPSPGRQIQQLDGAGRTRSPRGACKKPHDPAGGRVLIAVRPPATAQVRAGLNCPVTYFNSATVARSATRRSYRERLPRSGRWSPVHRRGASRRRRSLSLMSLGAFILRNV